MEAALATHRQQAADRTVPGSDTWTPHIWVSIKRAFTMRCSGKPNILAAYGVALIITGGASTSVDGQYGGPACTMDCRDPKAVRRMG